nr:hypothetical protein [Tanacetum cinerariifolium]
EVEINRLKERVKYLEDKERVIGDKSGDDAPIKGRRSNKGEAAAEKGKEILIESDTPKKKKIQEQIDAQMARELEKQQEREDLRMNEQIARDAEVARIHAEEEIQAMIDSLDKSNETVAKYLQEYQQFALELSLEKKIELINNLDHYKKVYKFQSQQRKPMSKKQKREYYMDVVKSYLGWRFKDFKDEPASPGRDDSQGEACPTDSGFIADQDRATIAKSSTFPYDSAPRVTSPAAREGSLQQTLNELM